MKTYNRINYVHKYNLPKLKMSNFSTDRNLIIFIKKSNMLKKEEMVISTIYRIVYYISLPICLKKKR